MMRVMNVIALISVVATPAGAAIQRENWQPRGQWTVNFADQQCMASRTFSYGGEEISIGFQPRPTTPRTTLHMYAPVHSGADWEKAKVAVGIKSIEAAKLGIALLSGKRIGRTNLTEAELIKIERGVPLSFQAGNRSADLNISEFSNVRKILNDCVSDLLETWGFSRAQQASLLSFPETKKPYWEYATIGDFPIDVLSQGESGETEVRVLVGADGVAKECRLISSSGHAKLDATTCAIFGRRARYSPARNKAGQAIEAPYAVALKWVNP